MSDNSQQPTNDPTQDGTVDDTAMENEENSNPSDNLTSQDGENQDGNFTQLELNSESDTTQSYEITSVKEKLKEAYYEIGRAAENAGDKYVVDQEVIDAIKFYKEALTNYENGNSQLSKNGTTSNESISKKKDALDPKLKFEKDDSKGYASVLNYNLPSSTSISMRNYVPMELPDDWFDPVNAFHYSGSEDFIDTLNEINPKKATIQSLSSNVRSSLISTEVGLNASTQSMSRSALQINANTFEQDGQAKLSQMQKEQEKNDDQYTMNENRKLVKKNHNEIKEDIFEILRIVEKMDKIFHSNQFNHYMKKIAQITGQYQQYDPESIISQENSFLENPNKMKKLLNICRKIIFFVDELIEKLKNELDEDAKKARDQELVDEVTRYEKALLDTESNYKLETKEKYLIYQTEIKVPMDAYKVKLEEIKQQLKEKNEEYKAKKEEYRKTQIIHNNYGDFNAIFEQINDTEQRIEDATNNVVYKTRDFENKIFKYRHIFKFPKNKIPSSIESRFHDYDYYINQYNKTIQKYQDQSKVYRNKIQNTTNERHKLRFISWCKKYDSLTKQLQNQKDYKSRLDSYITVIQKKKKLALSQQKSYNNLKNNFNTDIRSIKQKKAENEKLRDSLKSNFNNNFPETNGMEDSKLEELYKERNKQLEPLKQKLTTLQSDLKILKTALSKQYDSVFDEFNIQIQEIKTRYTNEQKVRDQQFVLNKKNLEKEHEGNKTSIKEKYINQFPEETQVIITSLNSFQDDIENKVNNIKNLSTTSLEKIDQIYSIADKYNYHVFVTKNDKKENRNFLKKLKENKKEVKENRVYSLIFEDSFMDSDESLLTNETLIPRFDLDDETNDIDADNYFYEQASIIGYTGIPDSLRIHAVNEINLIGDTGDSVERDYDELVKTSQINAINHNQDNNYQINANIFQKLKSYSELIRKATKGRKEDSKPRYFTYNRKNKKINSSKIFTITIDPETNEPIDGWPEQSRIDELANLGYSPKVFQNLNGEYEVRFIKSQEEIDPKIFMIYEYTISSFLGDYGAGKTIKTFSLLPGESTTITMKTWKTSSETKESAKSILESNDTNSSDSFQKEVAKQSEQSKEQEQTVDRHANTKASVSASISAKVAPVASASASVGLSAELDMKTNSKQNQKNTSKALAKAVSNHASTQSSKRESSVSESSTSTNEEGKEEGIVRELKNINQSRTLNFVFRQLNQEYITVIHITDIKLAFSTGFSQDYVEIPIYSMDSFINTYFRDGYDLTDPGELGTGKRKSVREKVKSYIVNSIQYVYDYKDRVFDVLDPVIVPGEIPVKYTGGYSFKNLSYKKFCEDNIEKLKSADPEIEEKYQDVLNGHVDHGVEGIVVDISRHVMRTDAIIVEALLGSGMALDDYAIASQIEAVREKQLNNAKMQLALDIINMADSNPDGARLKADIYYKLFGLTPMKKPFEKSVVGIVPELKDTFENLKVD